MDHRLPCVSIKMFSHCFNHLFILFGVFLRCTEKRFGRNQLSSAIDLELFEQGGGGTFDARTQAILTYSQPPEYVCSIMA